jgi:hypothetical protein
VGDDKNDNDNGDNNRITRNDQFNGGHHGPCAPRGLTATAAALAPCGFDVVAVAERSGAVRKCANARAFKRLQRASVRVFVLGQGQRDNSADGIVVVGGGGGARGNVHPGRRGAADDCGDADCNNILCLTKLLSNIYLYLPLHRSC